MKVLFWTDSAWNPVTFVTAVAYVKVDESLAISHHSAITGKNATTQRAELYAVVYALRSLKVYPALDITVYTDCKTIAENHHKHFQRDNADVYELFLQQKTIHNIEIIWLRRKSHPYSRLVHYLCNNRLREYMRHNRSRK